MKFLWKSLKELSPESEFSGGMTYESIICVKGIMPSLEKVKVKNSELQAAEPMRLLRQERNRRLAETDWVTIKAYSQSAEVSVEWKIYLQTLRDLPATAEPQLNEQGNLINITWPKAPE